MIFAHQNDLSMSLEWITVISLDALDTDAYQINLNIGFRSSITNEELETIWKNMDSTKFQNFSLITRENCSKILNIPDLVETDSGDNTQPLKVGEFFNLKCPEGLKLSFDNDSFQAWDDYYTVTCLPTLQYRSS